ncbi:hypothetical protein RhiJN_19239 [Ceratobasidium sp. AG-Ba]|nr:hypothetical protein RhiJN_19239 [Ceratobasidium sp. AG-Ba]
MNDSSDMVIEQESGRATRARTRLIVEGFSNLALVAILFTGVQAQLISVTNEDNDNQLAIATNAVFFGGLIFSVFTTMLATLAGRWFSILREDDSDYLSSCWLAQDCAELNDKRPKLEEYINYQINSLKEKIEKEKSKGQRTSRVIQTTVTAQSPTSATLTHSTDREKPRPESSDLGGTNNMPQEENVNASQRSNTGNIQAVPGDATANLGDPKNPIVEDLQRIIWLLQAERKEELKGIDTWPEERVREKCVNLKAGPTTMRERILSWTLLSALAASVAAFLLFCAGILLLVWNKQRRAVAIFTSATVLVCIVPLACFFLRHRHKHVIKHLHLARPGV